MPKRETEQLVRLLQKAAKYISYEDAGAIFAFLLLELKRSGR